jgi:hypothetical protein
VACRRSSRRRARCHSGTEGGLPQEVSKAKFRFRDFDDYWTPFLGGQAPAPGYAMSLSEDRRTELREYLRVRLPYDGDGGIPLIARAWAVRGGR